MAAPSHCDAEPGPIDEARVRELLSVGPFPVFVWIVGLTIWLLTSRSMSLHPRARTSPMRAPTASIGSMMSATSLNAFVDRADLGHPHAHRRTDSSRSASLKACESSVGGHY